mmetsp:Transcript_76872/g.217880  ORF Transcript_76872/g.217880 Transcript_76872/m.217880 type:complete len:291 (+) Transcript_76872:721-1593(+)
MHLPCQHAAQDAKHKHHDHQKERVAVWKKGGAAAHVIPKDHDGYSHAPQHKSTAAPLEELDALLDIVPNECEHDADGQQDAGHDYADEPVVLDGVFDEGEGVRDEASRAREGVAYAFGLHLLWAAALDGDVLLRFRVALRGDRFHGVGSWDAGLADEGLHPADQRVYLLGRQLNLYARVLGESLRGAPGRQYAEQRILVLLPVLFHLAYVLHQAPVETAAPCRLARVGADAEGIQGGQAPLQLRELGLHPALGLRAGSALCKAGLVARQLARLVALALVLVLVLHAIVLL